MVGNEWILFCVSGVVQSVCFIVGNNVDGVASISVDAKYGVDKTIHITRNSDGGRIAGNVLRICGEVRVEIAVLRHEDTNVAKRKRTRVTLR